MKQVTRQEKKLIMSLSQTGRRILEKKKEKDNQNETKQKPKLNATKLEPAKTEKKPEKAFEKKFTAEETTCNKPRN